MAQSGVDCLMCTIPLRILHLSAAEREHLQMFSGLLSESQGQNPVMTVLCVPSTLDSVLCDWVRAISSNKASACPNLRKNLSHLEECCLKKGSSQGQNLALTVSCVPSSLDSLYVPDSLDSSLCSGTGSARFLPKAPPGVPT